jgi:hypothetical protein
LKLAIRTLVFALAVVSATGCADVAKTLAAAAIPSGAPSAAPGVVASTAPTGVTPAATTAPAATPKPAATEAPVQNLDKEDCKAEKSDADKDNGTAAQGGYNNQWLPKGWVTAYKSEQAVTDAIAEKFDGTADWACFQKFYPGATTIYKRRTGM